MGRIDHRASVVCSHKCGHGDYHRHDHEWQYRQQCHAGQNDTAQSDGLNQCDETNPDRGVGQE